MEYKVTELPEQNGKFGGYKVEPKDGEIKGTRLVKRDKPLEYSDANKQLDNIKSENGIPH